MSQTLFHTVLQQKMPVAFYYAAVFRLPPIFLEETSAESTVWLKNFLNSATQEVGTEKRVHLVVDKKSVCHAAFKQLYGISNNKYYAALEKVSEPDVIPCAWNSKQPACFKANC